MFTISEECIHSQSNQFDFIWRTTDNVNFKVLCHNTHKEINHSINNPNDTSWQLYSLAGRWADASRSYLRFLFISFWWCKLLIKHEFLFTIKLVFLLCIIRLFFFLSRIYKLSVNSINSVCSNQSIQQSLHKYTHFRYLVSTKHIKRIIKNIMARFLRRLAILDRFLRLLCRWGPYWFCDSRWENIICKQQK